MMWLVTIMCFVLLPLVYGVDSSRPLLAAVEAANNVLQQLAADNTENSLNLARAVVALSFVEKYTPVLTKEDKARVVEALSFKLLSILKEKGAKEIPLTTLSAYINSLYALCEDPRDFHNMDLVDLLRSRVDEKENRNLPIVMLSLCLAKETTLADFDRLLNIYDDNDRIGSKALTVITMAACKNQLTAPYLEQMTSRVNDFVQLSGVHDIGLYTKALSVQAYNAWKYDASALAEELLHYQDEDGSFSDLVTTYAAIPALLNTSLADLQCKSRSYLAKPRKRLLSQSIESNRYIDCTFVIPYGENIGEHKVRIMYGQKRKSLFELMKEVEKLNPMYRFSYEVQGNGNKVIDSIAGISNDAESGVLWSVYKTDRMESSQNMIRQTGAIDWIFPEHQDHFIFQYSI